MLHWFKIVQDDLQVCLFYAEDLVSCLQFFCFKLGEKISEIRTSPVSVTVSGPCFDGQRQYNDALL